MSSIRTRALTLTVTALLLTGCGSAVPESAPDGASLKVGKALEGEREASSYVQMDEGEVGRVYRFALPIPYNQSSQDIEIIDAELMDAPQGVKVTGMASYSYAETDDSVIQGTRPGDGENSRILARSKNRIGTPARVEADSLSDIYYMVSLKVTGPVKGHTNQCRYTYRQAGETYTQIVGCDFRIALKK